MAIYHNMGSDYKRLQTQLATYRPTESSIVNQSGSDRGSPMEQLLASSRSEPSQSPIESQQTDRWQVGFQENASLLDGVQEKFPQSLDHGNSLFKRVAAQKRSDETLYDTVCRLYPETKRHDIGILSFKQCYKRVSDIYPENPRDMLEAFAKDRLWQKDLSQQDITLLIRTIAQEKGVVLSKNLLKIAKKNAAQTDRKSDKMSKWNQFINRKSASSSLSPSIASMNLPSTYSLQQIVYANHGKKNIFWLYFKDGIQFPFRQIFNEFFVVGAAREKTVDEKLEMFKRNAAKELDKFNEEDKERLINDALEYLCKWL